MSANTVKVVYSGSLPSVVFEGGFAVRGEPVEVAGALAERLCEQKHWNLVAVPEPDELTVDELKTEADSRGIEYPARVKKSELIELLHEESED